MLSMAYQPYTADRINKRELLGLIETTTDTSYKDDSIRQDSISKEKQTMS